MQTAQGGDGPRRGLVADAQMHTRIARGTPAAAGSAGLMKQFMVATFTDLVLRVALAELLSRTALGTTGIWISWPIGWAVSMVLSIVFYASVHWERIHAA